MSNPTPQSFVGHVSGVNTLVYSAATHLLISAGEVILAWEVSFKDKLLQPSSSMGNEYSLDSDGPDPSATFALDASGMVLFLFSLSVTFFSPPQDAILCENNKSVGSFLTPFPRRLR